MNIENMLLFRKKEMFEQPDKYFEAVFKYMRDKRDYSKEEILYLSFLRQEIQQGRITSPYIQLAEKKGSPGNYHDDINPLMLSLITHLEWRTRHSYGIETTLPRGLENLQILKVRGSRGIFLKGFPDIEKISIIQSPRVHGINAENLKHLCVKNCPELSRLEGVSHLETLILENTYFQELRFLEDDISLQEFILKDDPRIKEIEMGDTFFLHTMTVSNCKSLRRIFFSSESLEVLSLSMLDLKNVTLEDTPNLKKLFLYQVQLKSIPPLPQLEEIVAIQCPNIQIDVKDAVSFPKLIRSQIS